MLYSPAANSGGAVFKPKPSPTPSATPTGTASAPGPAAPTPPPAGTMQTAPGYSPDYGSLITSDPAYLAAQANANQAKAQSAAMRKAALQSALIRYGGMPSGFQDQYGDLTPDVLSQAQGNKNSVLANLANNYAQSSEQFKRSLAARGALQSGDLAYGADQLDKGYAQQQYDAANQFGQEAQGIVGQYAGVLNSNAQNLSQAIQGAEANVYSNPAYRPSAPQTANYDAANSAAYGQPVYADAQGNLFDQNGNPFNPSAGAPSAAPAASPYTAPTSGPTSLYQNNAALYGWL